MARPVDEHKRAELLAAVVGYLETYGIAGLSLRAVAAELGTSSRMLVYYFGTKENMLAQALDASRPDVAGLLGRAASGAALRETLLALWHDVTAGQQRRSAPLMLQVMALAGVPDSPYRAFAQREVDGWVEPLATAFARIGHAPDDARARATALVSGARGILLDRLVTRDDERTDAAVRTLVDALASSPR
ncbi:TetR/AcrR family transcriptional regulator [Streptomyces sp. XD-27]|uniref:TetR/AcrR family transcriptional regulator n=1 Tax=Streptomyces sp. XD-27 TaxID=3062779 RepID=UPI0026F45FE4|nr:TetR/AcrR family transcriptional regulator [Streptomyces sp. XD-27]WKX70906.1 TetR/AcrR family transcriptional regulator [Streptomyces sp. XD-27]